MKITRAKYLVGIDFGDGETTASCIEIEKNDIRPLNILNASLPDSQKVGSCIYKDGKGNWALATYDAHFSNTSLKANFKQRPSELTQKENEDKYAAFNKFIRIVFDLILKNNRYLVYDRDTGDRNFYLAIACPSKWAKDDWTSIEDDTEVRSYLQIVQRIIPVDTIIKESDAAYFHFHDQGEFQCENSTSLVIDYGSSTIDYTFFKIKDGEIRTNSDGSKSTDCGASKVEQAILDYLIKKNEKNFENAKKKFNEKVIEGEDLWKPYVLHYLKDKKENYYSNYAGPSDGLPQLTFQLSDFQDYEFDSPATFFFEKNGIDKSCVEGTVLKEYKNKIKNEFERIASKCKSEKWIPNHIMITGGASRMPWVEDVVRECFRPHNAGVTISVDQRTPSYVVSHGIVRYLYAYYKFTKAFDELVHEITDEYLRDTDIRLVLLEAFKEAVIPIYGSELKKILDQFKNGEFNNTFRTLAGKITDFKYNLSSYFSSEEIYKCNMIATNYIREYYVKIIQGKVENVYKCSFKLDFGTPIKIDLTTILSGFRIVGSDDEDKVKKTYAPKTYWGNVELDKYRDDSAREYVAEHFPLDIPELTLADDSWYDVVISIRDSVLDALEEVRAKIPFTLY